ncbi:hypothetical protein LSM04_005236 [Trypanosoma melophagium]|uniref:uncharacterized protein n=1 Tax=Trypanosoma melophagium TaxID=715481 RepID=UPI00351A9FFF|nr:hypothetical protein LSM04_005236 [Trypanosoma melophagium]
MQDSGVVSAGTGRTYIVARGGRIFPYRNFTAGAVVQRRFNENTTALAVTVGFVLPTMMRVHKELDEYVVEGRDMPLGTVVDVMLDAGKESLMSFTDLLARVAVQTGIACLLIRSKMPYCYSVVELWELYPQLHQFYVGELVRVLRLPPFLATLVGQRPDPADIEVFTMTISPLAAMEDCFKRSTLQMISDIVVDAGECVLEKCVPASKRTGKESMSLSLRVGVHVTLMVFKVGGAAAGRAVGGARGEYWGEIIGTSIAPLAQLQARVLLRMLWPRSGGSSHRSSRSTRNIIGSSKEGEKVRGSSRRSH